MTNHKNATEINKQNRNTLNNIYELLRRNNLRIIYRQNQINNYQRQLPVRNIQQNVRQNVNNSSLESRISLFYNQQTTCLPNDTEIITKHTDLSNITCFVCKCLTTNFKICKSCKIPIGIYCINKIKKFINIDDNMVNQINPHCKCPNCKELLITDEMPSDIKTVLQNIVIKCPFDKNCELIFPLMNAKSHLFNMQHQLYRCTFPQCNTMIFKNKCCEHINTYHTDMKRNALIVANALIFRRKKFTFEQLKQLEFWAIKTNNGLGFAALAYIRFMLSERDMTQPYAKTILKLIKSGLNTYLGKYIFAILLTKGCDGLKKNIDQALLIFKFIASNTNIKPLKLKAERRIALINEQKDTYNDISSDTEDF